MIALSNKLQKAVELYNEKADEEYQLCYYEVIDSLNDPSSEEEVQNIINTIFEAFEETYINKK